MSEYWNKAGLNCRGGRRKVRTAQENLSALPARAGLRRGVKL